jgi:hypothetical protein
MTVRLSRTVESDTSVPIHVGSSSLLTAPSAVTVESGDAEADFTVTAIEPGTVVIEAVYNGTKRITLSIIPATSGPDDPVEVPADPSLHLDEVRPSPDGAVIWITGIAKALQFAYDARPTFEPIAAFPPGANFFVHHFVWPSGTTYCAYRVQNGDNSFGNAVTMPVTFPVPPPPPPPILKAVIDKDGVEWQLKGKKKPYQLFRNRARQHGMLGVGMRKSAAGYMELLQVNGKWIRREGSSWVTVT